MGDEHGNVVHLYERECTIQRRNQKIIEEAPSPSIDEDLRKEICFTAIRLMREIGYTIRRDGRVYFRFIDKEILFSRSEHAPAGGAWHNRAHHRSGYRRPHDRCGDRQEAAVQAGRCASEPVGARGPAERGGPEEFQPSFGTITRLQVPQGPGVASGVYEGADIPPYYDSLFMLLITAGADRGCDPGNGQNAQQKPQGRGSENSCAAAFEHHRHPAFVSGDFSTRFIEEHMDELISMFREKNSEDEILKIARYVAEISALGPQTWM